MRFAYRRWPASGPRPTTAARARKPRRGAWPTGRRPSGSTALLAATLVLYAIQSAYSEDVSNAIENACFFLVPFAVMLMLLGEVRWTRPHPGRGADRGRGDGARVRRGRVRRVRRPRPAPEPRRPAPGEPAPPLLPGQLAVLRPERLRPLSGADVGRARRLPGLGARHPAARSSRRSSRASCSAALALSYSITSFAALLAGLLVVAALRWSVRWALAGGAAIARLRRGLPAGQRDGATRTSARPRAAATTTSGRVDLVKGGLDAGAATARSGAGARARSAPRSPATSSGRRRPSRTPSRSPSPPSRGRSGWSSTWRSWSLALIVLLSGRGRLGRRRRRRPPASSRWSSTASATRPSRSTRRPGRCSAWGSRCGEAAARSAADAAATRAPAPPRDPRPAAV